MTDGVNPEGNSSLSLDQGAHELASILSGEPEKKEAPPERADEPIQATETDEPDHVEETDTESSQEESEQSETETPEVEEVEQPSKVRLSDGTEATLDEVDEWRKGNLRQSDYTRKTMELAATRKELDSRLSEVAQKSQNFEQAANIAIELIKARLPQAPDMSLIQSDPIAYMQQKADHDAQMAQLQQLTTASQEAENTRRAQEQHVRNQFLATQRDALVEKLPELKDPAKARNFITEVATGLSQAYGVTAEDLSQLQDHRAFLIAKDALAYRKLMANKPKADAKAKDAAPVQKPGMRASPDAMKARGSKDKWDRLRRTGSLEDGASVLLDLVKG